MSHVAIKSITSEADRRRVNVIWQDGFESSFTFIWLRHYCNYPVLGRLEQSANAPCRIPEAPQIPTIKHIAQDNDQITIDWSHDDSQTQHSGTQLREYHLSNKKNRFSPTLWSGQDSLSFDWFDYHDFDTPETLLAIFKQLRDYGIALVRNIPTESGTLFHIAKHLGPVRRTHFGDIFDIRSSPSDQIGTGANIGATASNSQAPHMDEGWRHGPPGISFFHCLNSAVGAGGASQFVDGCAAAETLREQAPESFQFLKSVPIIMAAERNPQERFRSRARVIATDHNDIVRGVRISDRNFPPIDLPEDQIENAYQAMHDLARYAYASEAVFEHQLRPGELVIFDNHRVLHARRAFDPGAGERWMQQLSVDREEFHNIFRQLGEKLGDESVVNWEPDAGLLS